MILLSLLVWLSRPAIAAVAALLILPHNAFDFWKPGGGMPQRRGSIVGTTIAVDPKVIPRRSTVNVAISGQRKAQDTGGMINGYHIDEYVGDEPKVCKQLGRRESGITFLNY